MSVTTWSVPVRRGDVVEVVTDEGVGLAVVVQSTALDGLSTLLVAPLSTDALDASFRPLVHVSGRPMRALVELTSPVDRQRVGDDLGRLDDEDLWAVNLALVAVFDLQ